MLGKFDNINIKAAVSGDIWGTWYRSAVATEPNFVSSPTAKFNFGIVLFYKQLIFFLFKTIFKFVLIKFQCSVFCWDKAVKV